MLPWLLVSMATTYSTQVSKFTYFILQLASNISIIIIITIREEMAELECCHGNSLNDWFPWQPLKQIVGSHSEINQWCLMIVHAKFGAFVWHVTFFSLKPPDYRGACADPPDPEGALDLPLYQNWSPSQQPNSAGYMRGRPVMQPSRLGSNGGQRKPRLPCVFTGKDEMWEDYIKHFQGSPVESMGQWR